MNARLIRESELSEITPDVLTAYAAAGGWLKTEPYGDAGNIYKLNSSTPRIVIPVSTHFVDYVLRLRQMIDIFANAEKRDEIAVLNDLKLADVDRVQVSVTESDGSIPIDAGIHLLQQSRSMLLAAACSAQHPRPAFDSSAVKNQRVVHYLEQVRLGQTEQGSFVVNFLSPAPSGIHDGTLPEKQFAREVVNKLALGLQATREALSRARKRNDTDVFKEDSVKDGVSANLCDAVADILDKVGGAELDISVRWALTTPTEQSRVRVSFDQSDVKLLRDASSALKPVKEFGHTSRKLIL